MRNVPSEWDGVAARWDARMRDGDWFQRYIIYPVFSGILPDWSGKRILDVGCGNGHLCRFFEKLGARPTGIDVSEEMIAACRRCGGAAEYLRLDVTAGVLQDRQFDAVVFNNSFQDMRDYRAGIENALRMLAPRGIMAACVKHPCFHPASDDLGWCIETGEGGTFLSGPGLTDLAAREGTWRGKYFVMDHYLNRSEHEREWFGKRTVSYSRTISEYVNAFSSGGLRLIRVEEPAPLAEGRQEKPDLYDLLTRIPNFIFLIARKEL